MPKKVLIIEDEKALALNLELGLDRQYEIHLANSGKEGIAIAKEKKPDLILLDVMLPDLQGPDILVELKKEKKTANIPVIVLTNLDDPQTVSRILAAGGKEYLVKTDWSIDQIANKVRETLGE
jgi:DNA-binding response OmpR family regulator